MTGNSGGRGLARARASARGADCVTLEYLREV